MDSRCQFSIPDDIPRNEPIYLVQYLNNFTIYKPSGNVNYLLPNENLYVFCPGKKNFIHIGREQINSNITEVSCRNRKFTTKEFGDVINGINGINCTKGIQAELSIKKQKCSSSGHIIDVGFKLSNNILLPTFKICFDNTTWTPIWSKHVINGKSIKCM